MVKAVAGAKSAASCETYTVKQRTTASQQVNQQTSQPEKRQKAVKTASVPTSIQTAPTKRIADAALEEAFFCWDAALKRGQAERQARISGD